MTEVQPRTLRAGSRRSSTVPLGVGLRSRWTYCPRLRRQASPDLPHPGLNADEAERSGVRRVAAPPCAAAHRSSGARLRAGGALQARPAYPSNASDSTAVGSVPVGGRNADARNQRCLSWADTSAYGQPVNRADVIGGDAESVLELPDRGRYFRGGARLGRRSHRLVRAPEEFVACLAELANPDRTFPPRG
jgi:hypothetical protein